MAELLGRWACTPVLPASSAPPCNSLNLFSVAPSSTPWLGSVNSQLVWNGKDLERPLSPLVPQSEKTVSKYKVGRSVNKFIFEGFSYRRST